MQQWKSNVEDLKRLNLEIKYFQNNQNPKIYRALQKYESGLKNSKLAKMKAVISFKNKHESELKINGP